MDSPRLPRTFVLGKASAKPHRGRGFDATPNGREERDAQSRATAVDLLEQITGDHLPIVMLSTSSAQRDIARSYKSYANAYITKPWISISS